MDKIDYAILSCLKKNARMKASDISKEINLSVSAIIERIRKMESNDIIESYTLTLNQKKLGNDLIALMEVSLEHPKYYDDFAQMVLKTESIQSCYYLTGEYDFMLKILTDSSDSLERIHRVIKSLQGVSATKTHFVLKSVKNDMAVIPEIETM
ncbi:MAG: Lrp/AsnC family transcriptional regulator [Bacillota bacterium]|nr:Lrp/AsnC family transcriptional regulator [Bacillota bacterium]